MTALPNHVPPSRSRGPVADVPSYSSEPHSPRVPVALQAPLRSLVYTTGQVAYICRVATRTVSKWFDSGRLRGFRIPGSTDRRIPRESLIAFMREYGSPLGDLDPRNTLLQRVLLLGLSDRAADALLQYLPAGATLEYTRASGAFEAGALTTEHTYLIVVIDLSLGRTEGLRIAQALRRRREYRVGEALLLALACEDDTSTEELTAPGAFDLALKQPVDVGVLAERVREWVEEGGRK